ncbi:LysR family transcriptional regulator [Geomonas sp. RF6]|uniref:selenium metabolism-associated LysR family transcriptional regulator n=1 Tax=Geomonas sp. RF6 TaxID=2897342 RepID=UPI001E30C680|nr:selenium metabolism-associated LysR family transcriptional regulator [Geomonas sp. RF6]UFS70063.1 LysR family transcriptional regulator [Geomonas sp. RF6]
MNLKQLEVFLAVAESGSFSKGAESCFITQSTVSQHISALENEFGLKLLDRTGKGALPTAGGKVLMERAKRVVDAAREIPVALARFKGVEDAELKIGGSSIPGEYLIPTLLPLLSARFPGITVTVLQGDSRSVLAMVAAEEVEIAVVGARFEDDALDFAPLAQDEVVLIAPGDHRWRDAVIAASDLCSAPLVMREAGSGTGKAILETLRGCGIEPESLKIAARLGSNEAVKRAVLNGLGVSFVSAKSVERELAQGALVQVRVEGLTITREFFLAKRKGRELSPAARAFVAIMEEGAGATVATG